MLEFTRNVGLLMVSSIGIMLIVILVYSITKVFKEDSNNKKILINVEKAEGLIFEDEHITGELSEQLLYLLNNIRKLNK